jgi:hypothetical protein
MAMTNRTINNKMVLEVHSEPGDFTHYHYAILEDYDEYTIMPLTKSTFRFPQRLNWWTVKDLGEAELIELAEKENCNVYTLREVISCIKEIRSGI